MLKSFYVSYNENVFFFLENLSKMKSQNDDLLIILFQFLNLNEHYNHYLSNGVFEIFSEASVFLVLGALGIYFEYGKINSYNKNEIDEEE